MRPFSLFICAAAMVQASAALAEVPSVVATIKPLHALVASVMGDLGQPALIVRGGASAHTYSLKPSDAAALQAADLVFWTGHGLELFLEDSIGTLAPNAEVVELSQSPGITLLAPREGGTFEAHEDQAHADEAHEAGEEHAHEGEHEHGEEADMHFFLDPENAKAIVARIADTLSAADPENSATYQANAAAAAAGLDALSAEATMRLAAVKDRPFVVFHDAYQYFEQRFGLDVVGSITINPEIAPGADRITQIRDKLKTLDAACVFAEPQFDPRLVDVLIEGTTARAGTLDPEGANLTEGPGLYRELILGLAASLTTCLAAN